MYDRSHLVAVANDKGDRHYTDLAARLKVAPTTAWRLWTGVGAPSAGLIAAVQDVYGVPASRLLKRREPSAQAAA